MKPKAIIFDIDGTVAVRGEGPDVRGPFDWDRVGEDEPHETVMLVARMLAFAAGAMGSRQVQIMFVSGRDSRCRYQTRQWLDEHFMYPYKLFMREEGDNRSDVIVKAEMLGQISEFFQVVAAFDDRNGVVDMWRRNKITCFQVCSREDGDF